VRVAFYIVLGWIWLKLLNEVDQDSDIDCELLQTAVKIGILGVILQAIWIVAYTFLRMLYIDLSHDLIVNMAMNAVGAIGIFHAFFVSVGFVAIFAMKGSKLGIVFPLMIAFNRLWIYYYARLSYVLGIYSFDFYIQSITVQGYVISIIGGLALLTIYNRSAQRNFLIIFAIFYIFRDLLSSAIWQLIFGGPVPINSGFDVLITSIPNLAVAIAFAILTIVFFIKESKQGCTGGREMEEVPFIE